MRRRPSPASVQNSSSRGQHSTLIQSDDVSARLWLSFLDNHDLQGSLQAPKPRAERRSIHSKTDITVSESGLIQHKTVPALGCTTQAEGGTLCVVRETPVPKHSHADIDINPSCVTVRSRQAPHVAHLVDHDTGTAQEYHRIFPSILQGDLATASSGNIQLQRSSSRVITKHCARLSRASKAKHLFE